MTNIFAKTVSFAVVVGISSAAGAELILIDFNDFGSGVVITDQIEGVTISLLGAGEGAGPRTVGISNIINEPATDIAIRAGNPTSAKSDGPWHDIVFEFAEPTDYFSILSLDSDEPVSAIAFLGTDIVDVVSFRGGFNHQVWNLELGEIGGLIFDRVVIDVVNTGRNIQSNPGLFDNLMFNFSPVPTPGAFTLMATSGLIAMGRRRT